MTLLRGHDASPPRTLVDVLRQTAAEHPEEPALDNGAQVLTYEEFFDAAQEVSDELHASGIGPGDTVGVQIASGTTDLYVAIAGTLLAGAAYVPVDADDPDVRARTVFDEANVAAVLSDDLELTVRRARSPLTESAAPSTTDDAWVIFTSGSTGAPKGVAVSHRSAAAFVDAEALLFLQEEPLGPGDRVMAGLSVAFDASCEEMWLAWRHGACLVPVPRSLVRSGMELGPWLHANYITVVSTVPTLVALWPADALNTVRLLILGGEACPPELAARLVEDGREVWNTYGPTEATVVACAARLTGEPPVRIGLPLDGWDLAVVDETGTQVAPGGTGELIIGGVGLARYLDPAKDAEKYAPMATLGWNRAYRSGDLVRYEEEGLLFLGRADDQVKVGGRRIELGEIDSALLALPGVTGAAAAVRRTSSGNPLLVGYVATTDEFDAARSLAAMRAAMPAALVPRLAQVDTLPTRTSGKIDRDALPWPLLPIESGEHTPLEGTAGELQSLWLDILGATVSRAEDDFFDLGGGSLAAAQLVSRLRARYPEVTVADVYDHPQIGDLAVTLDELATPAASIDRTVHPVSHRSQFAQVLLTVPLRTITGLRWLAWVALGSTAAVQWFGIDWLPTAPWAAVATAWLLLVSAPGRLLLTAAAVRAVLAGVGPGTYPRGGAVHLRLWWAERLADEFGAANLAGAPLMKLYARLLGARVGRHVDLHSVPPITGHLTLGEGCSVEPEVDLSAHWLDGDVLRIGAVAIGPGARIGARSTLGPGARIGADAEIAPGSAVFGEVPANQMWAGAPARPRKAARGPWDERPRNRPAWGLAYLAVAVAISALPGIAIVVVLALLAPQLVDASGLSDAALRSLTWLPIATVIGFLVVALLIWLTVRLLGLGLVPGAHPVHGLRAWQAWATLRVLDEARTWLFPLYSSSLTPAWLRALGADIGPQVEASTVLLIPKLTAVREGAFLADDTMLGSYELGGGWLRVEHVEIGKHAFVGNSGMAAPGRKVPKRGLVAVLSAAPRRTKAKTGTSWLGSPPTKLRRVEKKSDRSRTYDPPTRLVIARAIVEISRVIPVMVGVAIGLGVVVALTTLTAARGWGTAALLSGVIVIAAATVAAIVTTLAKWILVGRLRVGEHPLWSWFVWRNELADTFVEAVAAPWFARPATGTPVLNLWLRSLGARIGRGVWCETYWLPEADLIHLQAGATVNQGCVVQTHLFHDRVLSMDTVTLRTGSTLGPNSVILPAATLGRHATVGPVSLVMRGEVVPDRSRWIGNPIGPWQQSDTEGAP